MSFNWYKLLNVAEFQAEGIPSRKLELELEDIGIVEVLVTYGFGIGFFYNGVFLSPGLNDQNPFVFEGHAAYVDAAGDLFLGIEIEE